MSALQSGKINIDEAANDFGWAYALFSSLVSAPSLLMLLQMVFLEHRLVDALQWIVDAYDELVATLASYLDPLVMPVIGWINAAFNWDLAVGQHWRPIFILSMVFVLAYVRVAAREGPNDHPVERPLLATLLAIAFVPLALACALAVGAVPLDSGWLAQARIASMPVILITLAATSDIDPPLDTNFRTDFVRYLRDWALAIALGAAAFASAGAITLHPQLARGAGLATLALFVFGFGAYFLALGLAATGSSKARARLRLGLTLLGGFATAALIMGADLGLRAFGLG